MIIERMDLSYRVEEKQLSRAADSERLRNGQVSQQELRKQNSFFGALDMSRFKIVAMGGKPISSFR